MSYELVISEPAYSSWSLRGWLALRLAEVPYALRWTEIYGSPPLPDQIGLPPARTVPVLVCEGGAVVRDSLAIAEELAQRHPDAPLWPADPALRGLARSLTAEMHSGFGALRSACPMNLRQAWQMEQPDDAIKADLTRLDALFTDALSRSGGPWLAGGYSVADAFYAPVCARIVGYGLPVGSTMQDYAAQNLAHPLFADWRRLAAEIGPDRHKSPDAPYWQDLPKVDWTALLAN
ncbi:glutathione S-transferase [Palleronia caenipelagi]|uniref:Glutathione S-transferase n=1 Tax=Palleronia caenipelagi TaxID=2489174 RepID=A0A547Q7E4_9RHOB|nr:glutathione S-transferase [Palleronia caenipelagi]TRD22302.1 glutathione S-transferase [Palleronia caenipelagi]